MARKIVRIYLRRCHRLKFRAAAPAMKGKGTLRGRKMKLLFIDVRKAHLNGKCKGDVYVELLEEARAQGRCGKLKRWLYGM